MAKSNLTSMTVSLPEGQKNYVRKRAQLSGCSTPSEYVRRLIHDDQRRLAREELEKKLLEGLTGEDVEMTPEDWSAIRAEAVQRLEKRKKKGT